MFDPGFICLNFTGGKASDDSLLMNLFNSMSTLETKFGPMNAAYYTLMVRSTLELYRHAHCVPLFTLLY